MKKVILFLFMVINLFAIPQPIVEYRMDNILHYNGDRYAIDSSGNNNHAKIKGDVHIAYGYGEIDNGFRFDGKKDYFELPSFSANTFSNGFTMSVWLDFEGDYYYYYRNSYHYHFQQIIVLAGFGGEIKFYKQKNKFYFYVGDCYLYYEHSSDYYNHDDLDGHYVVTMDKNRNAKIYYNGILVKNKKLNCSLLSTYMDSNYIGHKFSKYSFYGVMDEFKIWNVALTDEEVMNIHNSESNGRRVDSEKKADLKLRKGLILSTYDTSGYNGSPNNHNEYNLLEKNYTIPDKLFGRGIVFKIDTTGENNNPFNEGVDDNYLSIFTGYIKIENAGWYSFVVDGDDAIEFLIEDNVVAYLYGEHNASGSRIYLEEGYYEIKFRHQDYNGSDSYKLKWKKPGDNNYSVVPEGVFFHRNLLQPIVEYRMDYIYYSSYRYAKDSSGNNYHASVRGGVRTVNGKIGKGFRFNGDRLYLKLPSFSGNTFSNGFTISMWLYFGDSNDTQKIISFSGPGDKVEFYKDDDKLYFYVGDDRLYYEHSNNFDGHYVLTMDKNCSVKMYYNGFLVKSEKLNCSLPSIYHSNFISSNDSDSFYGVMDEFKIWNVALTHEEVMDIYRNENIGIRVYVDIKKAEVTDLELREGLILSTYDTSGYNGSPNNHNEYNLLEKNYTIPDKLFGRGIVFKIDTTGENNNPFNEEEVVDDNYLSIFTGYIKIEDAGWYSFVVDGDDAIEFLIGDNVVAYLYGEHNASGSRTIYLGEGYYEIKFRHQDYKWSDSYKLKWKKPGDNNYSVVPKGVFFHRKLPQPIVEYRMDYIYYSSYRYAKDSSGNNKNARVNGNVYTTDGIIDKGFRFNGDRPYLKLPPFSGNTFSNGFTISVWLDFFAAIFSPTIIKFDGPDGEIWFFKNSNKFYFSVDNMRLYYYHSNCGTCYDDFDGHYVVTMDKNGNVKIYYNGVLVKSGKVISFLPRVYNSNFISSNDSSSFYGVMDEFKIWNVALTDEEVMDIYMSEKNGTRVDSNFTYGLVEAKKAIIYNFDAWDIDKGISNKKISTKIANKEFNLTIASLDENGSSYQEFNGTLCYRLISDSYISNWSKEYWSSEEEKNVTFVINKAIKNAKVNIRWIANEDKDCSLIDNETNSSDSFAIRPDRFDIVIPSSVKAGEEFNITIKALNYNEEAVQDYNETINNIKIEFNETKPNCKSGTLSRIDEVGFKDGEANITLKYDEIGDINISIKEINGSEFALVDSNDTDDLQRLITDATKTISVGVDHFEVDAVYLNHNKNFTYLDEELNIASILELNITAKNKDNKTLENYNRECYAKDILINISHSSISDGVAKIIYKIEGKETIKSISKDENISFNYEKDNFSNGSTFVRVYINFDRSISNPVSPFEFNIAKIDVRDTDANGSLDVNKNVEYYYGNLLLKNIVATKNDFNQSYSFLVYDKSGSLIQKSNELLFNWYKNSYHEAIDGNITDSEIFVSSDYSISDEISGVDVSVSSINNGKITFNISRSDENIKFVVVHLLSENLRWLWYSKFNKPYDVSDDSTCLNHFCFTITWESSVNNSNKKLRSVGSGSGTFKGADINITGTKKEKSKIFR